MWNVNEHLLVCSQFNFISLLCLQLPESCFVGFELMQCTCLHWACLGYYIPNSSCGMWPISWMQSIWNGKPALSGLPTRARLIIRLSMLQSRGFLPSLGRGIPRSRHSRPDAVMGEVWVNITCRLGKSTTQAISTYYGYTWIT